MRSAPNATCRPESSTSTRPTIGAETHLPFGGIKNTGNGHRESGEAALDFYSEWKTIYIDYSDRLQRAQIDNAD